MCDFILKLLHSVAVYDLNVIGLLIGFLGGLQITIFGLPPIGVLNQGMYVEIENTKRMRVYNWLARTGLFLVMAGFLFQLIPAVQSVK
jgi:hypothetical protein